MTEEKVKNRGWVKNAAIIFLAVMLVLTFFSQTIMNRSLPEVSAQYVQSGAITTRIRGTGKIEAVETYEVKSTDSRKVESVNVKVGDTVETGTLLFTLAKGDSSEVDTARQALEDAQYAYQKALINAGSTNANGDNRTIQRAREKLESAMADVTANTVTDEQLSAAKSALDTATAAYNAAVDKLTAAGGETSGSGSSGNYSAVQAAEAALSSAKVALSAANIQYKSQSAFIQALALYAYNKVNKTSSVTYAAASMAPYAAAIVNTFLAVSSKTGTLADYFTSGDTLAERTNLYLDGVDLTKDDAPYKFKTALAALPDSTVYGVAEAYNALASAQKDADNAQTAYNSAVDSYYSSLSPDNSALMKARDAAKRTMDSAQTAYDELKAKKTALETAKDAVLSCQDTLEQAIISQKLETLDLQKMRQDVADKQAALAKVSTGTAAGGEILSSVNGVVTSIGVTAGNTTSADTVMAAIEVPDRGYTASITVTTEQAKKVTVGDTAEITTGYWGGSDLTGQLVTIKPDATNPQASKVLVFSVTGSDIASGTQVNISIGQKSQNFDVIVPNAAVREDSNGSFVLAVVSKSSPLGNRYVATRVDVQVQAKDDNNTAVSGGLTSWDYVITNSTKPIESGMQVRIADNG